MTRASWAFELYGQEPASSSIVEVWCRVPARTLIFLKEQQHREGKRRALGHSRGRSGSRLYSTTILYHTTVLYCYTIRSPLRCSSHEQRVSCTHEHAHTSAVVMCPR